MRSLIGLLMLFGGLLFPIAHAGSTLIIIASPGHENVNMDADQLALIFQRKQAYWPDGSRIQPVNLPVSSAERSAFSRAIFQREPAALNDYWRERYFHGVRPPYVVASNEAMLRFLLETPSAIGYVDLCLWAAPELAVLGYVDESGRFMRASPQVDCKKLQ